MNKYEFRDFGTKLTGDEISKDVDQNFQILDVGGQRVCLHANVTNIYCYICYVVFGKYLAWII